MKKLSSLFTIFLLFLLVSAYAQWEPAGERIRTEWADDIDPASVWDAYPRPLLKRNDWKNLNGLWNYSIDPRNIQHTGDYDGEILVPFPVESSLSGVNKEVGENSVVWYERSFTVPSGWKGKDILLHFGAVDWQADVWINDIKIGSHTGGYTAFNFNITPYLNPRGDQKLVVRVWDPTDESFQPRLYLYDATRPTALSEYGGIGLALEGHLWEPERNWGYIQFATIQDVTDKYLEYAEELKKLIKAGISAAVYTQITDVEVEVNGLMTYDRKRIKMDMDRIRQANSEIRAVIGER